MSSSSLLYQETAVSLPRYLVKWKCRSLRHLQENGNSTSAPADDGDNLDTTPEDVDNTEAGWATDFTITILAAFLMYTAWRKYNQRSTKHWFIMYLGTAIAHLGGGLAHSLYPNRATDGTGMIGFYITFLVGYFGNCMRYGSGWGFTSRCWLLVAVLNYAWLMTAGIYAMLTMETTTSKLDDAETNSDDPFLPDVIFGYGELFVAVMEIWASIYYLCRISHHTYSIVATVSNIIGWISVYAPGLWSFYAGQEYDTRITQLIFHYCMLIMLWAINELALIQTKEADEYYIPRHTKKSASALNSNSQQYDTDLPLGILLTGGRKLRDEGWDGSGIRVAVIDSGIDNDHPGFNGKVTRQAWYRDGSPLSKDDHGTHVAGTVHLMAPGADILDYRVFGKSGDVGVTAAIALAIKDATDKQCQLINMSLGGPVASPQIKKAVDYAFSQGVTMICAAGNEGDNNPLTNEISYPACYDECLSIAAVQKKNGFPVATFSNSNEKVDYAGIGVDVISFKPGGGYQKMSGTSMASPHACGLMACLTQKYGALPHSLRRKLTYGHVIDIGAEGIDNATGVGFLTYLTEKEFEQYLPRKQYFDVDVE